MIEVLLLAAGASTRMNGPDKLLLKIDGVPLLRRSAEAILPANITRLHVILPPESLRKNVLKNLPVNIIEASNWLDGMAASIRAGMAAISPDCKAVVIALADMPDIDATHVNALIAAFSPTNQICRAQTADGTAGNPVLFGKHFFPALAQLKGDKGARDLIASVPEYLHLVPTKGQAAVIDLNTPAAWTAWQKK